MIHLFINGALGYQMGKLKKGASESSGEQQNTIYDVVASLGSYDKIGCEGTAGSMDTIRTMISLPGHRDVLWLVADEPIVFGNTTEGMIQMGEVIYDPPIARPSTPINAIAIGFDFMVVDGVCHVRRMMKKFNNVTYTTRE